MNPQIRELKGFGRDLWELYAPIFPELERTEEILREAFSTQNGYIRQLLEHGLRLSGKRLRPALVLLSGQACGQVQESHCILGAVIELIHTATLIHDDVLDEATRRRHLETVNARWDNEASVLLGDYVFTIAICLTAELKDHYITSVISRAGRLMCEGELHQISQRGNFNLSEEEYLEIIRGKTAELYASACQLGAYLAHASEARCLQMARFGEKLGIAFQIVDDILDLAGKEQTTGKSLGTDLLKQKATLPVIRSLQVSSPKDRETLLEFLRHPNAKNMELLRKILERCEAIDYSRERAREFVNQAVDELSGVPANDALNALRGIADFVLTRER